MHYGMKMKLNKRGYFALYLAMISVIIATIFLIAVSPLPANAACSQSGLNKTKTSDSIENQLTSLHAELKLTNTQESEWQIFTGKTKLTQRLPKLSEIETSKLNTPERLDQMLSVMKLRQQNMESHVQTVKGFYSILDQEQRKIFDDAFLPSKVSMNKVNHLINRVAA